MKKENPYDQRYAGQEYCWGKKPSAMCDKVIEIIRPSSDFHPKLLDLGCGEGRNAVYFAKHGFVVVGLDLSLPGLEKTRRYAEELEFTSKQSTLTLQTTSLGYLRRHLLDRNSAISAA